MAPSDLMPAAMANLPTAGMVRDAEVHLAPYHSPWGGFHPSENMHAYGVSYPWQWSLFPCLIILPDKKETSMPFVPQPKLIDPSLCMPIWDQFVAQPVSLTPPYLHVKTKAVPVLRSYPHPFYNLPFHQRCIGHPTAWIPL